MRIAVGVAVAFVAFGIAGGVWTLRAGGTPAPSPAQKVAEYKPVEAPAMKVAPLPAATQKDDITGSITPPPAPAPKQAMSPAPAPIRTRSASAARSRLTPPAGPASASQHFKQLDFLRRQGSGADLRRRSLARPHPGGAEGARRRVHHRHLLCDRQARDLLSGRAEAGCRRGPYGRHPTPGRTPISTRRR